MSTLSQQQHPEYAYLDILKQVMEKGEIRSTRNARTKSLFSLKMDFQLTAEKGEPIIPLLTTKRVYWKGVVKELLWFLRGDTNAHHLSKEGVKIWDWNSSREALDVKGLTHYEEGDCGPIYGYQWRHFGAKYNGHMNKPYGKDKGIDQWSECVRLLKEEPTSRRIFMSAWNPVDLDKMCLPPCHVSYQFYVKGAWTEEMGQKGSGEKGKLYCLMNQRSADLFLGVPFNIASVSLMVHILCYLTGLEAGGISIVMGDAHIYEDQWEVVREQLSREPIDKGFPRLYIRDRQQEEVEDFEFEDFVLENYQCHSTLKAKMIV